MNLGQRPGPHGILISPHTGHIPSIVILAYEQEKGCIAFVICQNKDGSGGEKGRIIIMCLQEKDCNYTPRLKKQLPISFFKHCRETSIRSAGNFT